MPNRRIKLEDGTKIPSFVVRIALGQSKYTVNFDYSDGRAMTCTRGKRRFSIHFDKDDMVTWASLRDTLETNHAPIQAITKRIKDVLREST